MDRLRKRALVASGAAGFLVLAVMVGGQFWKERRSAEEIKTACQWAGLAPPPLSAQEIRVFRDATLTWTGYYLKFKAAPPEINSFLRASPGVEGSSVKIFRPSYTYLPEPPGGPGYGDPKAATSLYFRNAPYLARSAPWFDRTVRKSGRRYRINWHHNFGELVVDDATHTVYVYVADS